jgi:transglutaminase-like putative cysteine protease
MNDRPPSMAPSNRRLTPLLAALLLLSVWPTALAEQGLVYCVVVAGMAGIAVLRDAAARPPLLSPPTTRILALLVFVWLVLDRRFFDTPAIVAIAHFMMLISAIKLCGPKRARDYGQVAVLTLLLLVVSAIVSGTLMFPVALAAYVALGPYAFILLHVRREIERVQEQEGLLAASARGATGRASGRAALPPMRGPALLSGLAALLVGVGVFLCHPSVGTQLGAWSDSPSPLVVSGLADTATFGALGTIAESQTPVMRVEIEPGPKAAWTTGEPLLLRGAVLDVYTQRGRGRRSGWEWRRGGTGRTMLYRLDTYGSRGWTYLIEDLTEPDFDNAIIQHIWLEAPAMHRLYAAHPVVAVRSRDLPTLKQWQDDQTIAPGAEPLRQPVSYSVMTVPEPSPAARAAILRAQHAPWFPDDTDELEWRDRSDDLPAADRIRALAQEWTDDLPGPTNPARIRALAARICDTLRDGRYAYTLSRTDVTPSREPVEDFLFHRRRGHCEYFASALVIMCRSLDIDARLVQGYRASEFNPIGNYYVVRERDAHAWAEVFVPDRGWVTFDPTPPAGTRGPRDGWLATCADGLDYLQFRWATSVVNYDADQRGELLDKFRGWLSLKSASDQGWVGVCAELIRNLSLGPEGLTPSERILYWFALVLVLLFVSLVLRVLYLLAAHSLVFLAERFERPRKPQRRHPDAALLDQFFALLSKYGVRRPAHLTPREFADTLVRQNPRWTPAVTLVNAFYAAEYGGRSIDPQKRRSFEMFLAELKRTGLPTG